MNMISLAKDIKMYISEWNETLESIIKNSPEKDKTFFRQVNRKRPGLGAAGYGTNIFAQLFDMEIDHKPSFLNSSLVFMCGIIDDENDRKNKSAYEVEENLNKLGEFLKTGCGEERFKPFRQFLTENYPEQKWSGLLTALEKHKNAVLQEDLADSYSLKKLGRIEVGATYARVVGNIISAFSRELSKNEKLILTLYSTGSSLLDNIADYCQDKANGQKTHVTFAKEDFPLIQVLKRETDFANDYFKQAKELLPEKKIAEFESIVKITKFFYCASFFKKAAKYCLK